MRLEDQIRESAKLTDTIQIRHPYSSKYKTLHRKPKFKNNGVYVQIGRGLWEVTGYKKLGILKIYEVE